MNQRPTSTRTRRCCYALLVTVLLLIMFRNPVTRIAAVEIGSRILGTQVEIDSVWIGWLKVGVTGIRIHEPESDDLQFEIAQMVAGLTPWDGMRHGIWAHRVVLQKPSLHLRFDRDGKLRDEVSCGRRTAADVSSDSALANCWYIKRPSMSTKLGENPLRSKMPNSLRGLAIPSGFAAMFPICLEVSPSCERTLMQALCRDEVS